MVWFWKKIQEDIYLILRGDILNRPWFFNLTHKICDSCYELHCFFNYFLFNDMIIKIDVCINQIPIYLFETAITIYKKNQIKSWWQI
jgi:hypothetical protein